MDYYSLKVMQQSLSAQSLKALEALEPIDTTHPCKRSGGGKQLGASAKLRHQVMVRNAWGYWYRDYDYQAASRLDRLRRQEQLDKRNRDRQNRKNGRKSQR